MSVLKKIKGSFLLNIIQIISVVIINLFLVKRFGAENLDQYYYFQVICQLLFHVTSSVLFNSLLSFKKNLKLELIFLCILYFILSPIIIFVNYSDHMFDYDLGNIMLINSMIFLWIIRGFLYYILNTLKLLDINKYTNYEILELSIISFLFIILDFKSLVSYIFLMAVSKLFLVFILVSKVNWKNYNDKFSYFSYFKNFSILYLSNFLGYIYTFSERTFLLNLDPGTLTLFHLAQKFVNPVTSVISGSNNLMLIFKTQIKENFKFLKSILSFNISISIIISIIIIFIIDILPQFLFDLVSIQPTQKKLFITISSLLIISIPFSSAIVIYKKYLLSKGKIKTLAVFSFAGASIQLLLLTFLPIEGVYKIIALLALTTIFICFSYHILIFKFSYIKKNLILWVLMLYVFFIINNYLLSLILGLMIFFLMIIEILNQRKNLTQIE